MTTTADIRNEQRRIENDYGRPPTHLYIGYEVETALKTELGAVPTKLMGLNVIIDYSIEGCELW